VGSHKKINKNYIVVLWVAFYLKFESVFSLMMDYFNPKHVAFFEDLYSCVGLIMWCCLEAWRNKQRKSQPKKKQFFKPHFHKINSSDFFKLYSKFACRSCINIVNPESKKTTFIHVRFEVITVVLMKIQVFWCIFLCQQVNSFWCFRDTLLLQNSGKIFISYHNITSQKTESSTFNHCMKFKLK
jgi:hypothetical protein